MQPNQSVVRNSLIEEWSIYMCDACVQLYAWLNVCFCVHVLALVCVHVPKRQYISTLAVYCIAGDLSQLAGIQSPGVSASSCGDETSKSAFCLTKHYSSRPPSVIINRGAKIINESQIHRVMMEVTAQIGKLFLLTQHFFCVCCCWCQCLCWLYGQLLHLFTQL